MYNAEKYEICPDSRECFAKKNGRCIVLQRDSNRNKGFYSKDGECPFCKPHRDITNGEVYYFEQLSEHRRRSHD
jgi:hypothetical protein